MKKIKYFIIALCILSACNERSNEDIFFSKLSDIVKNETWLINENSQAIEKVLKLIEKNPASLDYQISFLPTKNLSNIIDITTSDDGNVRVYNINSLVPNGNRSFDLDKKWIIQYRIGGIVYTDVWDEKYSSVIGIHSVQSPAKTYYLFVDYSSSTRQRGLMDETVTAYSINPQTHKFQKEHLFKTAKEFLSNINISWADSCDTGDNTIYSELHHIYCNDKGLRIPLVTDNKIMTEGYLLYLWDGECFKFKGIEPVAEFKAKGQTARINILPNGEYKYSSWGKNRSTFMTPDIVLYNGEMTCWDETGECDCNAVYEEGSSTLLGRKYSFKNNGYLYCFEYGWWKGTYRAFFTISKGGEEILSTKAEILRSNECYY